MTYIFVGGSARSGTHLLESILTTDSKVNAPLSGASHFHDLISIYAKGKNNFKPLSDYYHDITGFRSFYSNWILKFLEKTKRQHSQSDRLILRWPYMATLFPALHELVQDSKFLLIVRDPRDTIVSMMKVAEREAKLPPRERTVANLGRDMVRLSQFYSSYYIPSLVYQARSDDFRQKILWVKYESLVGNTISEVKRISNFTGLEIEGIERGNVWHRRQPDFGRQDRQDVWFSSLYGKKISKSHVGQYRNYLSDREISEIEDQCNVIFDKFNYRKKREDKKIQLF